MKAMPTAASSSHANGSTSTAPWNQKKVPIPIVTRHSERYNQPSWAGVTEQWRPRNQWMPWPWTVAKRNTKSDLVDARKQPRIVAVRAVPLSGAPRLGAPERPQCCGLTPRWRPALFPAAAQHGAHVVDRHGSLLAHPRPRHRLEGVAVDDLEGEGELAVRAAHLPVECLQ